jgi:hypothetical protein
VPDVEVVDEEPPAYLREVAEEALADVAAGRTVICTSDEAFDALLDELSTDPGGDL